MYSSLDVFPPPSALSALSESDSDYPSAPISLTISAGTTSGTVMIMASNDSRVETQEMFTLSLTTSDPAVMPQSSTIVLSPSLTRLVSTSTLTV